MQEPQQMGERLRAARLAKGVSLEEAAAATRIRRSSLQALEADDFSSLPPPVYTRGFLLNYARYLGLVPEEVVEAYDRQQRESDEPSEQEPQDEKLRRSSSFGSKLLLSVVLVIAIGVILNFLYQEFLSAGPALLEPEAEATPTSVPTPLVELPPLRTPTPIPTPSPAPSPTPTPITGVNLTLRSTTQGVWLQVTADGETVYLGTIGPETDQGTEPLTWEAEESISILFGRTGGVEITVNGRELDPLVETGVPLTFAAIETDEGDVDISVNGTPLPSP